MDDFRNICMIRLSEKNDIEDEDEKLIIKPYKLQTLGAKSNKATKYLLYDLPSSIEGTFKFLLLSAPSDAT